MATRLSLLRIGATGLAAALSVPRALAAQEAGTGEPPGLPPFEPHRVFDEGGRGYSYLRGTQHEAVPSACWQCVSRCPIIGYKDNGRLVKIEGQPDSIRSLGKICAKSQAGLDQLYDPDRILHPMRRVGARGEGKWKRVSWDEALDELAQRLKALASPRSSCSTTGA